MSEVLSSEMADYIVRCVDYPSPKYAAKSQQLTRKIMVELIQAGRAEFLLLRDDDVSQWWREVVTDVGEKVDNYNRKVQDYQLTLSAWNKLTEEDRKILKIRMPKPPKAL
jgi:hypothetical protein